MNPLFYLLGGLALLLANAGFFWLNPSAPNVQLAHAEPEHWHLEQVPQLPRIDPQRLVDRGVWGEPPAIKQGAARALGPDTEAQAEEARLRQQLRGIVRQAGVWRVLFEQPGAMLSLAPGDRLGEGPWQVHEVQPDYVTLQEGDRQRSLKLFSAPEESPES